MSAHQRANITPAQFWDSLKEIIGEDALATYQTDRLTQTDVARLIKGIGGKPEALRLPMAKYLLSNCSLNSGMFNQLIGLIGWVEPADEPELVLAIAQHQQFDEEYIWEIHRRSDWMENPKLKTLIQELGIDATKTQLIDSVTELVQSRDAIRFFD